MVLSGLTYGMVLVTGTAGSGKSTTQACLFDRINQTWDCHIIDFSGGKGMATMDQFILSLCKVGRTSIGYNPFKNQISVRR